MGCYCCPPDAPTHTPHTLRARRNGVLVIFQMGQSFSLLATRTYTYKRPMFTFECYVTISKSVVCVYRFRGKCLTLRAPSFFFSFSPEFRGVQLGEELVLKLNSPGPCYLKIHHPFLVAFYFIDSTGRG
jgi:hypothetical protein